MRTRSWKRGLLLAAGLLLAGSTYLTAHDFWLVPELFRVPDGWTVHVAGQTGMEFPKSTSAIAPDRIARAELVSADRKIAVERTARSGASLMMEARPTASGQWWIAAALEPRTIRLTNKQFNGYLRHDGVWDVLERREGDPDPPSHVREEYTKYAKALVQVGDGGPDAYDRSVGHRIEFVPVTDPFALKAGEDFRVRLLWKGEPLANEVVFAGREDAGEAPTWHSYTDSAGIATVPVFVPGSWYVKAIQMVEAPDEASVDYRSYWATLSFHVGGEGNGDG